MASPTTTTGSNFVSHDAFGGNHGSRLRLAGTLLCIGLAGCQPARPATTRAEASGEAAPRTTVSATDARAVGRPCNTESAAPSPVSAPTMLSGFDCAKVEVPAPTQCLPFGDTAVSPLAPSPAGLRGFRHGGPEGAAWNAAFLECAVTVNAPCEGSGELLFLIGTHLVWRTKLPNTARGHECRWGVAHDTWEKHLDDSRGQLYDTAMFRVEYSHECEAGQRELDRDAFVAGFATGE